MGRFFSLLVLKLKGQYVVFWGEEIQTQNSYIYNINEVIRQNKYFFHNWINKLFSGKQDPQNTVWRWQGPPLTNKVTTEWWNCVVLKGSADFPTCLWCKRDTPDRQANSSTGNVDRVNDWLSADFSLKVIVVISSGSSQPVIGSHVGW